MSKPEEPDAGPSLERFAGEVTHDPADWRWLWERELEGSLDGRRGSLGRLLSLPARVFHKLTGGRFREERDRQRRFNLVLLSRLENLGAGIADLGKDLQRVQGELAGDLRSVRSDLVADLERLNSDLERIDRSLAEFKQEGLSDLGRQTEALFSLLDHKLDRVRRQIRELGPGGDAN